MDKLTKEDIGFLKELGKEMREQDNDYQANPRFWAVGDYEERIVADGYGDESKIIVPEWEWQLYTEDEIKKAIEENCDFDDWIFEEFWNSYDIYEITNLVQEHIDSEARIVQVSTEHVIRQNTMFLTKEEAKEHTRLNHYHYSDKAHTYAMTAWRAPKVNKLYKILEKM